MYKEGSSASPKALPLALAEVLEALLSSKIRLSPNKCLSTPCPSAAQAAYWRCRATAVRKRLARVAFYTIRVLVCASSAQHSKMVQGESNPRTNEESEKAKIKVKVRAYRLLRISHGLNPLLPFLTCTPNHLRSTFLIFPRLGAFVCYSHSRNRTKGQRQQSQTERENSEVEGTELLNEEVCRNGRKYMNEDKHRIRTS